MPLLKMMWNPYDQPEALHNVLDYILNKASFVGGVAVDPNRAEAEMMLVKRVFNQTEGRQIRHFILSFNNSNNENITLDELYDLSVKVADYYGRTYQTIFGIHTDSDHLHVHFACNTVSYLDGRMYREGWEDATHLQEHIQSLVPDMQVILGY